MYFAGLQVVGFQILLAHGDLYYAGVEEKPFLDGDVPRSVLTELIMDFPHALGMGVELGFKPSQVI